MSDQLQFVRRAEVVRQMSGLLLLRHWRSTCGRYRVTESRWTGESDFAAVCIASRLVGSTWVVISRHRKRDRAAAACRDHLRTNETLDRTTRPSRTARKRRTAAPAGTAVSTAITPGGRGSFHS